MEVILYSKECNWYTRCCLLNGGVRYRVFIKRSYTVCMYMYIVYMYIYLKLLPSLQNTEMSSVAFSTLSMRPNGKLTKPFSDVRKSRKLVSTMK